MSSACVEHLDFLHFGTDNELEIKRFAEKDVASQFQSLTDISPQSFKADNEGTWVNVNVSSNFFFSKTSYC